MPRTPFVARERELNVLQTEWESSDAKMLILYGRRRVGKTRLVTHWIETASPRALYWVAEPTSSKDQLRAFSQALFDFESSSTAPDDFSYSVWWTSSVRIPGKNCAGNGYCAPPASRFCRFCLTRLGVSGAVKRK